MAGSHWKRITPKVRFELESFREKLAEAAVENTRERRAREQRRAIQKRKKL
jgi:hypothetical protein